MFRALKCRNLRFFLAGQLFSLIGTWMQIVAGSWLVYRLTNSPWLLGVFAFALNFPTLIFAPFAGIAADRFDRRHLLFLVNILSMAQALVLWVLVVAGLIQVWHLLWLSVFLGILNAFELPLRQSLISQLIDDPADLPNAIALNSSVFNGSRLIGPAVAGASISFFGEGLCFLLNAISFIPIILSLFFMHFPSYKIVKTALIGGISEGFRYVYSSGPICSLLIMVSVLSMASGAFHTLSPVFAREVFGGGPEVLGFLLSCSGFGALLGAAYLAWRRNIIGLVRVAAVAGLAAGVSYMAFAVSVDIRLAVPAVFFSGVCIIASIGGMNIVIQTLADEYMRGRVMSFYGIALVGVSPLGSLASGAIAARFGVVTAMFFSGLIVAVVMGYFWFRLPWFRSIIHPIYTRKGIFPVVKEIKDKYASY